MFTESAMIFFYCQTPLHAGAGASVSYVDLPIQREKHTDYPVVQSGGVKGAFRDWAGDLHKNNASKKKELLYVFGPEPAGETASDFGGSLSFTDAQILLFPVRSVSGGFAWITCPMVINRLSKFLGMMKVPGLEEAGPPNDSVMVSRSSKLKAGNQRIILEDFAFTEDTSNPAAVENLAKWIVQNALPSNGPFKYIKDQLAVRLGILSNTRFKDFVRLSTEIVTRVRIGQGGTVEEGPWTEELLPSDSLLYSLALAKDIKYPEGNGYKDYSAKESIQYLKDLITKSHILQLGGDETVGRGLVEINYMDQSTFKVAPSRKEASEP